MFDKLTGSFQKVFRNLRGYGKLSDANINDALREVRMALLEADVNLEVVKGFIAQVRAKCVGIEVTHTVTPGQEVTKFVFDAMVNLLGDNHKDLNLTTRPATVLLLGLHGSGKTTTTGKLALRLKKAGKKVLLVACDIRRPAAVDQLKILAGQVGVDVVAPEKGEAVPALGTRALNVAKELNVDVVLFDTGGRFQIDEELVQELKDLKARVEPHNVVLVLDAAIGQESVNVAMTFNKEVGLTGLILTKLDGDARGGAALSIQSVTGCPILLVGTGEKMENLEPFYPDRMASRILGMGDVVSLVEKAQASINEQDMIEMQEKLLKDTFTLEDFLAQMRQMKKLGPLENLLEMMPGAARIPAHLKKNMGNPEKDMKRTEALILAMTPQERRNPNLINASRRRRIAKGSGMEVKDVNELLKKFDMSQQMIRTMKKQQKRLIKFGR